MSEQRRDLVDKSTLLGYNKYNCELILFRNILPTEYKLLCLLAKDAGKVLTHTYLTDRIWGSSWESDMASLRVHMATLRKKLEKDPDTQYIQTHIGIGYRMLKVE